MSRGNVANPASRASLTRSAAGERSHELPPLGHLSIAM
jgi:hypothetical protein